MKLPFEAWVEKQNFKHNIKVLFDESIICYKAKAYRAALLFSYLGFTKILQNRILTSSNPENYEEREWTEYVQASLRKPDNWDLSLFKFTQQKGTSASPKVIFDIPDELREQIKYWKNRRNECAHAKDEPIDYFHVESFWLFLQTHLPKLVVGSGFDSMLLKIDEHFDTFITPVTESHLNIVSEIGRAVISEKLLSFFVEAERIIKNHAVNITSSYYKKRHLDFWDSIFQNCRTEVKEALIDYLKIDVERLNEFIFAYPNRINELGLEYAFGKNFWSTKEYFKSTDLKIIIALQRCGIIPVTDLEQITEALLNKLILSKVEPEIVRWLNSIDYFTKFKAKFLTGEPIINFNDGNRIGTQIIHIINTEGINDYIVQTLTKTFRQRNYPYALQGLLVDFFSSNPTLTEDLKQRARRLGLRQPTTIFWE